MYEVITGRLSFTFWRKVSGEWQSNNIQLLSKVRTAKEDKSSGKVGADEKVGAVWESTAEGGIQMKEPRVLAVHARRWSKSSAEFDKPMSFFQFNQLHNLNWNLVQNQ